MTRFFERFRTLLCALSPSRERAGVKGIAE
jgi:hypothetical protein